MMLPCSQFADASRQQDNRDVQTFLVGDYFSPKGTSAALQRLPGSEATTADKREPPPGEAPFANRRRRERNFTAMAGHDASS